MQEHVKQCTRCLSEKPISLFFRQKKGKYGVASRCKACIKEYRFANRHKLKEYFHSWNIKNTYGLSGNDYALMLKNQNGLCAANNCEEKAHGGRLSVDHDHSTGRVRGLLCHACNMSLGRVNDSIEKLKGLIAYLERTSG